MQACSKPRSGYLREMNQERNARYCLLLGGALWGLYWIPMKQVEAAGLSGTAPSASVFATAFVLTLPLIIWRWKSISRRFADLFPAGLFAGGALGLFTVALAETEIVRALLLFYLSPVWSTILGIVFLGDRPNAARLTTLGLGLLGLAIVLGFEGGFPWPRNLGDTLALIAGASWSLASLKLFRMEQVPIPDLVGAMVTGCAVVTGALFFITSEAMPSGVIPGAGFWVVFSACYIVPTLAMTLWPATLLPPAKAGLLLMTEVVVGTASAALLSGEPFGLHEAIGSVLITGALLAEVVVPVRLPRVPPRP